MRYSEYRQHIKVVVVDTLALGSPCKFEHGVGRTISPKPYLRPDAINKTLYYCDVDFDGHIRSIYIRRLVRLDP